MVLYFAYQFNLVTLGTLLQILLERRRRLTVRKLDGTHLIKRRRTHIGYISVRRAVHDNQTVICRHVDIELRPVYPQILRCLEGGYGVLCRAGLVPISAVGYNLRFDIGAMRFVLFVVIGSRIRACRA